MNSSRKLPLRLVLAAVAAVAGFLLLETLLFLFNDQVFHSSFYIFDPEMGFRVRPYARYGNEVANEFGFNDRDYPHVRSGSTYRILCLGDSFNWMGGQQQNYTAILEREFEEAFGPGRVEVISAGYSQTHTGEQLIALRRFGLQYRPDLVVLGFYAGNDFFDADPLRKRIVVGSSVTDIHLDRDLFLTFWGRPLVLRSRFLLYLADLWNDSRWKLRQTAGASVRVSYAGVAPPPSISELFREDDLGSAVQPSLEYLDALAHLTQFMDPDRSGDYSTHEAHIFSSLRSMESLLRGRGIELVVACFPAEIQVSSRLRQAFVSHYGLDTAKWEWDRPQRLLREYCSSLSVEILDFTGPFRDAIERGEVLYIPNDSHWNGAGNERAAQLLFEFLSPRLEERPEPAGGVILRRN